MAWSEQWRSLSCGHFQVPPALIRKRGGEYASGMCPQLVNNSLALHTNEQHRTTHTHLVNILRSILMKNQGSIINCSLANLIRGNLVNPFGWFCRFGQHGFILSSVWLMAVSAILSSFSYLDRSALGCKVPLSCAEVTPDVLGLWYLARAPDADEGGDHRQVEGIPVCTGSL